MRRARCRITLRTLAVLQEWKRFLESWGEGLMRYRCNLTNLLRPGLLGLLRDPAKFLRKWRGKNAFNLIRKRREIYNYVFQIQGNSTYVSYTVCIVSNQKRCYQALH